MSVEVDPGKAPEQAAKGDARFHAGDIHAGTGVLAVAEGDVPVGLARDVETLGVRKLARVAIGGADADGDKRALRKLLACELDRGGEPAGWDTRG